jgi:hypothetical protein
LHLIAGGQVTTGWLSHCEAATQFSHKPSSLTTTVTMIAAFFAMTVLQVAN